MEHQRLDLPLGGSFTDETPDRQRPGEEQADFADDSLEFDDPELRYERPPEQHEAARGRWPFRGANTAPDAADDEPRPQPAKPAPAQTTRRSPAKRLAHEPRSGLYGLFWRLLGRRLHDRFGWEWLVLYSKRDRVLNALDDLWALRTSRKVIACVNSGGGSGKTTTTTWLAAAAAVAFKNGVVCIDANENAGHTADRFGIAPKKEVGTDGTSLEVSVPRRGQQVLNGTGTIRLREFIQRRHEFGGEAGRTRFLAEVDRHRLTGAFVIASNAIEDMDIEWNDYVEALAILKTNEQLVFADCGNGLKSTTNHGSVHAADTLVFPGTPNKKETLVDLRSTMRRYANHGYADKVESGFVIILGDNPRKRKKYAKRYGVPLDHVIIFPVNGYMKDTDNPVSIEKLPLRLQVILFEGLLAIVEA